MNIPKIFMSNTEWMLIYAGQKASAIGERLLKPLGVTVREMTVMKIIDGEKVSQQMIADTLSVNRNAIVDIADSLEGKGLATRKRNPENRRQQFILLTPKGESLVKQWQNSKDDMRRWASKVLTSEEQKSFNEMLIRLLEF